jgi:hypothetical protein
VKVIVNFGKYLQAAENKGLDKFLAALHTEAGTYGRA